MDLAAKFNLSVTAYGELLTPAGPASGSVSLRAPQSLDPAPISPISAQPFQVLAGSILTARNTSSEAEVFVAPGLMTGNTGGPTILFCLLLYFCRARAPQTRGSIGHCLPTSSGTDTATCSAAA
jgi:hypothetical protein